MSYHALARKYRPITFSEMVGQNHVTQTLRAAIRKDKLTHAYLFAGPRGCGKTTVARLLAKALNCLASQDGDPCGECDVCRGIAEGSYLDVLEIDAASYTGVDNIRDLRDMAQYSPTQGGSRVFIIDEVHMLSKGAFNALLKILEEPPTRVYFFFATTEPTKVPRTILSRCQRFDFRLLTRQELAARIQEIAAAEGVTLDPSGLRLVITLAEGSMRDALSVLDQLIAGCDEVIDEQAIVQQYGLIRSEVYRELNEAILARDSRRALQLLEDVMAAGQSLDVFAQGIVVNFRNLLLLKIDPELGGSLEMAPEQVADLTAQAEKFTKQDLLALIDRANSHYERIHRSTQPRILIEAALVEYTLFESRVLLSDLVRRLQVLEGNEDAGYSPSGGPGARRASAESASPRGARRAGGRWEEIAYRGAGRIAEAAAASRSLPSTAAPDAQVPATADASGKPGQASSSAAADTIPGWTGFIQVLLETHPGLASCLMEGLPSLEDHDQKLVVAFPTDKIFQLQRLRQGMATLQEKIGAHWNRNLKLELVTTTASETGNLREDIRRQVAPTEQEVLAAACQQDGPLANLVGLIQGEPVPADEREGWSGDRQAGPPQRGAAADDRPTVNNLGDSAT